MFNSNYDDVEEEDEDPSGEKEFGGKNVIIFLVDGSTRMHETLEGGDTLFNTSIAAINAAMKEQSCLKFLSPPSLCLATWPSSQKQNRICRIFILFCF